MVRGGNDSGWSLYLPLPSASIWRRHLQYFHPSIEISRLIAMDDPGGKSYEIPSWVPASRYAQRDPNKLRSANADRAVN